MSDLEFLYAVMAAFYLWECTHWVRLTTVPFVAWIGQSFHDAKPFFVANSREAGLVFASPVPGFGTLHASADWPVALSPLGVANEIGMTVRFTDHPRFTSRRQRLMANGQLLATVTSPAHARWLVQELNRISKLTESDRESEVKKLLAGTLDSAQVAERLKVFDQAARLPGILASMLFLFVFLMAPALIWRVGLTFSWPWLLGGLLLLCVVNALVFRRAHKRLHPQLEDERFAHFLMVLLFPPAGMRTGDMLSRPLLERFHPLAAAKELCEGDHFEALVGRTLRESRYPCQTPALQAADAAEVWGWFSQCMLEEVERFATRNQLEPDKLVSAPQRTDRECRSYCPRCHAQFILTEGACSDCGVALERYSHS